MMGRSLLYLFLLACITPRCFANQNYFAQIKPIPNWLQQKIYLYTWHAGCPVPISDLVYIQLFYWSFDNKIHIGSLIVNKKIGTEVVDIFRNLYLVHFPIARMEPIENFQGNDFDSMAANNTSAFNCREITGSHKLSQHAYGTAIDINPLYNPYVSESVVLPTNASQYLNRNLNLPGMITHQSTIYQIFKRYDWNWGGDWHSPIDYQHFEKDNI